MSELLFSKYDGSPISFKVIPHQGADVVKETLTHHGGECLPFTSFEDDYVIRLMPPHMTVPEQRASDVFSTAYVTDCSRANQLLELETYRLNNEPVAANPMHVMLGWMTWKEAVAEHRKRKSTNVEAKSDEKRTAAKPIVSPRGTPYSFVEKKSIIEYIVSFEYYQHVKGRTIWKEMEIAQVCSGRTWQSMRSHFLNFIIYEIGSYKLEPHLVSKFQNGIEKADSRLEVTTNKKIKDTSHSNDFQVRDEDADERSENLSQTDDIVSADRSEIYSESQMTKNDRDCESQDSNDDCEEILNKPSNVSLLIESRNQGQCSKSSHESTNATANKHSADGEDEMNEIYPSFSKVAPVKEHASSTFATSTPNNNGTTKQLSPNISRIKAKPKVASLRSHEKTIVASSSNAAQTNHGHNSSVQNELEVTALHKELNRVLLEAGIVDDSIEEQSGSPSLQKRSLNEGPGKIERSPKISQSYSVLKKQRKQPYSMEEKRSILEYIMKYGGYGSVKGNNLWKQMETIQICKGRTWQSMKEHYIKVIIPNIKSFSLQPKVIKNILAGYRQEAFVDHGSDADDDEENIRETVARPSAVESNAEDNFHNLVEKQQGTTDRITRYSSRETSPNATDCITRHSSLETSPNVTDRVTRHSSRQTSPNTRHRIKSDSSRIARSGAMDCIESGSFEETRSKAMNHVRSDPSWETGLDRTEHLRSDSSGKSRLNAVDHIKSCSSRETRSMEVDCVRSNPSRETGLNKMSRVRNDSSEGTLQGLSCNHKYRPLDNYKKPSAPIISNNCLRLAGCKERNSLLKSSQNHRHYFEAEEDDEEHGDLNVVQTFSSLTKNRSSKENNFNNYSVSQTSKRDMECIREERNLFKSTSPSFKKRCSGSLNKIDGGSTKASPRKNSGRLKQVMLTEYESIKKPEVPKRAVQRRVPPKTDSTDSSSSDDEMLFKRPVLNSYRKDAPHPLVQKKKLSEKSTRAALTRHWSVRAVPRRTATKTGRKDESFTAEDTYLPGNSGGIPAKGARGYRSNMKYYTKDEDWQILKYISEEGAYLRINGKQFWENLERKNIVQGRTWQSMKQRLRSVLIKRLDDFSLSEDEKEKFYNAVPLWIPNR